MSGEALVGEYRKSGDWRAKIKLHISVAFLGEADLERFVDLVKTYILSLLNHLPAARMTIFRLKQLASTSIHAAAGAMHWNYDRAELIADGVVHIVGICFGLVAATVADRADRRLCHRRRCRRGVGLCRGPAGDAGAVGDL